MCPVRSSSSAPRRAGRLAAVAALLLAGCKVDVAVSIDAEADGSGQVTTTVTLDEAAAAEVGPLDEHIRVEDLRDAGWTVIVGDRVITATKRFDHPDEASPIVQEVGGALISRARVTRSAGFAKTTTEVDVEVDLTSGLRGFADAALIEQLGGLPAGFDPKNLSVSVGAEAAGESRVKVDVPVGQKAVVATSGTDWHVTRLLTAVAAPLLAIAAAVLFYRRRTVPAPEFLTDVKVL